MSHTPGPWRVHPTLAEVNEMTDGRFSTPICKWFWPTGLRSIEETLSNARLIAAAPELLEILEQHPDVQDQNPYCSDPKCLACTWTRRARAVIAQAKGEQS